jgi:hypothetical protein
MTSHRDRTHPNNESRQRIGLVRPVVCAFLTRRVYPTVTAFEREADKEEPSGTRDPHHCGLDSGQLREKILIMVSELRRVDDVLVKKTGKLLEEGKANAAAIRAFPEWRDALSENWKSVFEQHDAVYDEMRTCFEVRFIRDASLLVDEVVRQLGDVEPPRPSPAFSGHPAYPEVKRQLEVSKGCWFIRHGFKREGSIASPSLSYVADYLQTLADRLG